MHGVITGMTHPQRMSMRARAGFDAVRIMLEWVGASGSARLYWLLWEASRNGSACTAHRVCTSASVKSLVKNPVTGSPFGSTCGVAYWDDGYDVD